jgi:hypothetical protein
VDGIKKSHAKPALNATMPLINITDHTRPKQNLNLTSL